MYKGRRDLGLAQIPLILGLIIMAVAIPVATRLAQKSQDVRNRATESGTCWSECDAETGTCNAGLSCVNGRCRNWDCQTEEDCTCGVAATMTPRNTPTPTTGSAGTCEVRRREGILEMITANMTRGEITTMWLKRTDGTIPSTVRGGQRVDDSSMLRLASCGEQTACSNGTMGVAVDNLPPGEYKLYCQIDRPGNRCNGDPSCIHQGLAGGLNCSGWTHLCSANDGFVFSIAAPTSTPVTPTPTPLCRVSNASSGGSDVFELTTANTGAQDVGSMILVKTDGNFPSAFNVSSTLGSGRITNNIYRLAWCGPGKPVACVGSSKRLTINDLPAGSYRLYCDVVGPTFACTGDSACASGTTLTCNSLTPHCSGVDARTFTKTIPTATSVPPTAGLTPGGSCGASCDSRSGRLCATGLSCVGGRCVNPGCETNLTTCSCPVNTNTPIPTATASATRTPTPTLGTPTASQSATRTPTPTWTWRACTACDITGDGRICEDDSDEIVKCIAGQRTQGCLGFDMNGDGLITVNDSARCRYYCANCPTLTPTPTAAGTRQCNSPCNETTFRCVNGLKCYYPGELGSNTGTACRSATEACKMSETCSCSSLTGTPTAVPTIPSPTPTSGSCMTTCPAGTTRAGSAKLQGDGDCDGRIDQIDFQLWLSEFVEGGAVVRNDRRADYNCDGQADMLDFAVWLSIYYGNNGS